MKEEQKKIDELKKNYNNNEKGNSKCKEIYIPK
jgi:hypothetical protein